MPADSPRLDLIADAWLGGFLGCPAYRARFAPDGALVPEELPAGPLFAYAKIGLDALPQADRLVRAGFRLVDTAVTLERPAGGPHPAAAGCRFARPDDREPLAAIARRAFRHSRFHADPAIPPGAADAIKAAWVRNHFDGRRGTHMVVAERDGAPVGFNLLIAEPGRVVIDLIAVAPGHQGGGIGEDLIAFALARLAGDRPMVVGTQLANLPSLRLYTRLGFRVAGAEHVLHLTRSAP